MALETFEYIDDLNASNPVGASDAKNEGDNHLRGIKTTIKNSFPNFTGAMTATDAELSILAGSTATAAEMAAIAGSTSFRGTVDAAGAVDAITADFTPNVALTDKTTVLVRAIGANVTTTPTFAPDGLTAKTITKNGNQPLVAGDIYAAGHVLILQYNSSNDVWELLNVSTSGGSYRGASAYRNVTQSISDSTWTAIIFDTEVIDTSGIWEGVTNPTRLTVPAGASKIRINAQSGFDPNATGVRGIRLYKNGGFAGVFGACKHFLHSVDATNDAYLSFASPVLTVVAGDYFEVFVYQTSTVALNLSNGAGYSWAEMELIE